MHSHASLHALGLLVPFSFALCSETCLKGAQQAEVSQQNTLVLCVQMADMHVGRGSLCTAMQGYMLWAVGGRDAHTFHNSTECFHPGQNRWTKGPSTITKRFAAASGYLHNAIYITGGFDASSYTASGERIDPEKANGLQ